MRLLISLALAVMLVAHVASIHAADKPIKTFICAGQSNMVGYGDSTKLPADLRKGNDRVLMFENGKWQPLRPHKPAIQGQRRLGLTEFSFGPEIAFGHEMAKAFPDETIGIIKHAAGGTSLLAWKPDWTKEEAARVGQVVRDQADHPRNPGEEHPDPDLQPVPVHQTRDVDRGTQPDPRRNSPG